MYLQQWPTPPSGLVVGPPRGTGPNSIRRLQGIAQESPAFQYTNPRISQPVRNSPHRSIHPPPFPSRGPPPPRPPRPDEVTPMQVVNTRNENPVRTPPRSSEDRAQCWDSPGRISPKKTHSRSPDGKTASNDSASSTVPSSASSTSSSPASYCTTPPTPSATGKAFPLPPSASRRGGASPYFPGTSFSPILEESPDTEFKGRVSVASSRVIPSSWGSHPDDYNFDRIREKIGEEEAMRNSPASLDSTASMHDDSTGLVREASVGKKMKPSLTKITNSSENTSNDKATSGLGAITDSVAAGALGRNRDHQRTTPMRHGPSIEGTGNKTNTRDRAPFNPPSSSQTSSKDAVNLVEAIPGSRSLPALTTDKSAPQFGISSGDIRHHISKGLSPREKVLPELRLSKLDREAVEEPETRASVTSLPDLIRRAARLASSLDRGRTARRTEMVDRRNAEKKEQRRRSGSVADLLASFPPPSRDPHSRLSSPFPSKLNQQITYLTSQDSGRAEVQQKSRRCCGMPRSTFVIVMLLLVILVVVAVVAPIALIVLPRQRQAQACATGASGLDDCPASARCQNGGSGVVNGDTSRCICVNGFTGDRCGTFAGPDCTLMAVETETKKFTNVTVGNVIPRLLSVAMSDYRIGLNSPIILSLLSSENLSCSSQNALVTFGDRNLKGRDAAQRLAGNDSLPFAEPPLDSRPTPTPQTHLPSWIEPRQLRTSNGIVFQATSTAAEPPLVPTQSSSTAPTSVTPSPAITARPSRRSPSAETMDFARIAVLFILEQTQQLNAAVKAHDNIQGFLFNETTQDDTLSLNSTRVDMSLDFAHFSIAFGNGTEVGGQGDGNGGIRNS